MPPQHTTEVSKNSQNRESRRPGQRPSRVAHDPRRRRQATGGPDLVHDDRGRAAGGPRRLLR
jgi:hypothetical protein